MITFRAGNQRGQADHGWLQSRHTFSFASYYDPQHMGVSALRVINDDRVAPGKGFATHSHSDMEIISYVKKGTIEHKDSMGNIERLPAGEFQLMSAGTGVTHSEYNPSQTDSLEFLQIWVQPNVFGIEPEYQQKRFAEIDGLQLIASADGRDGSLLLHQNASLFELHLPAEATVSHFLDEGRCAYLHVISGRLSIEGQSLSEGDGVTVSDTQSMSVTASEQAHALLFDLP